MNIEYTNIGLSFLLGFVGSLHCVGMCGPLQSFLNKTTSLNKFIYHYGRYIAYSFIGLIFYLIGYSVYLLTLQKYLTIISGVILILSVFTKFNTLIGNYSSILSKIMPIAKNQNQIIKFFLMGFANGLLPCGLVYIAATQIFVSNELINALLLMLFFLIGTLPALLSTHYVLFFLESKKIVFPKFKMLIILSMGILLILRGIYSQNHSNSQTSQNCVSVNNLK